MKDELEYFLWTIGFKKYCFQCDDIHTWWRYRKSHYRCWRYDKKGRGFVKWLQEFLTE